MSGGWTVAFYAEGLRIEKLMNEAAKCGIKLRFVGREQDRRVYMRCSPAAYHAFAEMAREKGYGVTPPQPVGIYGEAKRLLKRKGLLIGLLLLLPLLWFSTRFVWGVRVENAGAYQGEVLMFLEENGIRPGIRRDSIDLADLRERLEWRLPGVQWVRTGMDGMRLVIRLEQGTPPPEIMDRGAAGDVVAADDGILLSLTVFSGTAACQSGDPVRKGQVLIRGEEQGKDGTVRRVKARGQAMARVFLSASAESSLWMTETVSTGQESRRQVLVTPFFSFSAQPEPMYLTWDEERRETPVGGAFFPIWLRRETRREAALERVPRSEAEARREAGEMALFALQRLEKSDEFVDKWVDYSMIEGEDVVATATAEIRRDIARN